MTTIEIPRLQEAMNTGRICLIDVRTPAEYRAVHIEGADLVPLDSLDVHDVVSREPELPLYLICKSGGRSRQAAKQIADISDERDVIVVAGGTDAWIAAGLPVVRGKATISLERQVRIAAGTLVAVGTALGWFVAPPFFVVPAVVGCGLIFAGITDTCGMGMLLAKMPWNR